MSRTACSPRGRSTAFCFDTTMQQKGYLQLGHGLGLISDEQLAMVQGRQQQVSELAELLDAVQVRSDDTSDRVLESLGTTPLEESQPAAKVLRRPQVSFADLLGLLPASAREMVASASPEVVEQLDILARYEGYIRRQTAEINRHRATETMEIPGDFDYRAPDGLTYEAKDKLTRIRPATLGQASRIPGVSPADISVLLIYVHRALIETRIAQTKTDWPAGEEESG